MGCFWIEFCKTKTKVITKANQKIGEIPFTANKIQSKTSKLLKARDNECDEVVVGFSFGSMSVVEIVDREFSRPITERSKANPTQSRITIDIELKIALSYETKQFIQFYYFKGTTPKQHSLQLIELESTTNVTFSHHRNKLTSNRLLP